MKIYQRIFEFTPDALLVVDQTGHITMVNAQAETLFDYDRSELVGQPIEMLIPPRFAAHHARHRAHFMSESHDRPMGAAASLYAQRKDGNEFPVDIMLSPMIIDGNHFVLCVVRDITERKAAEDALRHKTEELQKLHARLETLANRDSLTGLFNRRAFYEHAELMLRSSHRRHETMALMMLDLDHFKRVNDQFGHAEGDVVLQAVAAALQATARENDIVARFGGEEFVVAVLGANEAESLAAAERLRAAIAAINNLKSPITVSIGVTSHTPQRAKRVVSQILAELLDQADHALYFAKNHGRNQVCHFNSLVQTSEPSMIPSA
jgi:diguanylate cyclase (GGDEF)-like protein/PAS domain S-box-containing protein